MGHLPAWMPNLIRQINFGVTASPLLRVADDLDETLELGRQICIELWPFIERLPLQIALVRDALPERMEAARKLLSQMADDERHFQRLYLKQCQLAGFTEGQLRASKPSLATINLSEVLDDNCRNGSYQDGVLAIMAAELSATAFSRCALPIFERYFAHRLGSHSEQEVEEGLAWLKLHASAQTKHAFWMKRMFKEMGKEKIGKESEAQSISSQPDISQKSESPKGPDTSNEPDTPSKPDTSNQPNLSSEDLPAPVAAVMKAVYRFWRLDGVFDPSTEKPMLVASK